jgi:hypothetical protein
MTSTYGLTATTADAVHHRMLAFLACLETKRPRFREWAY